MRAQLQEQEAQERAKIEDETRESCQEAISPIELTAQIHPKTFPLRHTQLHSDDVTIARGGGGLQRFPDVASHEQTFTAIDELPELLRHGGERAPMQERQRSLEEEAVASDRVRRLRNTRSMDRMSILDVSSAGARTPVSTNRVLVDSSRRQGLQDYHRAASLSALHRYKITPVAEASAVENWSPAPLRPAVAAKTAKGRKAAVKFKTDDSERVDSKHCHLRIEDQGFSKSIGRYRRNLLIVSVGLMLVFSAVRALQNLQTSVNEQKKLGVISMTILYGSMFLSGLAAPRIIAKLTSKWSLVLGVAFHLIWIGANFEPSLVTLAPAAAVAGLGQSLTWGGQVLYFHQLSELHGEVATSETQQREVVRLNGIFLALFQTSHVWGNLASSLLLTDTADDVTSPTAATNDTMYRTETAFSQCGAHLHEEGKKCQ